MWRFVLCVAIVALASPVHVQAEAIRPNAAPSGDSIEPSPVFLTAAQRRARAERIRDTAAAAGMTNAALLAGIGEVETNFAHCWSEATWACKGPNSSSCGDGPVIAGASDGPCSDMQGGLGMFQFDSGTFSQTIATYGPDIVTIQGNVNAVIPFLVTRSIQSVDGIDTEAEALAWMNSIKILNGDPAYEDWLYFVAWRYNGCMGCTTQINKYRNGTNKLRDEFGPDFWKIQSEVDCAPIPADGRTIDETDACFHKSGTATSWYVGDRGMDGACLYTYATDDAAPDNHATWELRVEVTGRYRVEVYTDGGDLGQTHQARYVVTHAAGSTEVVVDQAAAEGFRSLGEFELVAGEAFGVTLGDNTGEAYLAEAKIGIVFDAVRVVPAGDPDPGPGPDPDAVDGGCAAGATGARGSLVFALAVVAGLLRRRRR